MRSAGVSQVCGPDVCGTSMIRAVPISVKRCRSYSFSLKRITIVTPSLCGAIGSGGQGGGVSLYALCGRLRYWRACVHVGVVKQGFILEVILHDQQG
jgi:hypothetical protein